MELTTKDELVIKPTHSNILVEEVKEPETLGGLFIPDIYRVKNIGRAKVLAVGTETVDLKGGEIILVAYRDNHPMGMNIPDTEWYMLKEKDAIAILEEDGI